MSTNLDNSSPVQPAQVSVSEISAILAETRELSLPGVPRSRLIAFQERKAEVFDRLAAEEPGNTERAEVSANARARLVELYAQRERTAGGRA